MFDDFFSQVQDFASTQVGSDVTSWLKQQAQGAISGLVKVGQPANGNPGPGQVGSTPPLAPPATPPQTVTQANVAQTVKASSPVMLMSIAGGAILLLVLLSSKGRR